MVSMSAMMSTNLKGSLGHFVSLQAGFEVPGSTLPVSANTVTAGKAEFTLGQINVVSEFSITCSILEYYFAQYQQLLQYWTAFIVLP